MCISVPTALLAVHRVARAIVLVMPLMSWLTVLLLLMLYLIWNGLALAGAVCSAIMSLVIVAVGVLRPTAGVV